LETSRLSLFVDRSKFDAPRPGIEILLATWAFDAATVAQVIEYLPDLRWVHSTVTGVDHIDLNTLATRGITLTSPRFVHARRIAEFVLALIYADAKNILEHAEATRNHRAKFMASRELAQITVGIIGYGAIGKAVASLAQVNGLRVIAHVRDETRVATSDGVETSTDLAHVLQSSDALVLALPLTQQTRGFIGAAQLRALKPTSMLINVGRGETIVEHELVRALRDGSLRRACLDVLEDPVSGRPMFAPPPNHPLYRLNNVLFTGYSSSESRNSGHELLSDFIDNLLRYQQGEELKNKVDLGAGY
jgi:phosphoglycerate dehydrogenase-like enzyme